jgi:cytochrome c oxidase assembly protein subunit 15
MGRLVGATYILPAAYFLYKGRILPKFRGAVVGLGALIGVQGLIGWFMVKSGLDVRGFFREESAIRVLVFIFLISSAA